MRVAADGETLVWLTGQGPRHRARTRTGPTRSTRLTPTTGSTSFAVPAAASTSATVGIARSSRATGSSTALTPAADAQIAPDEPPRPPPAGTPLRAGRPDQARLLHRAREPHLRPDPRRRPARRRRPEADAVRRRRSRPTRTRSRSASRCSTTSTPTPRPRSTATSGRARRNVSDYVEKAWFQNYGGRGRPVRLRRLRGHVARRTASCSTRPSAQGISLLQLRRGDRRDVGLFPDKDRTPRRARGGRTRSSRKSDLGTPAGNGCYPNDASIGNGRRSPAAAEVFDSTPAGRRADRLGVALRLLQTRFTAAARDRQRAGVQLPGADQRPHRRARRRARARRRR